MLWLFVQPTGVYLLDFFCSCIQFYLLLSPYLCADAPVNVVETTLCNIIFMHYVLNIIYQLYGEDTASILTF